MTLTRTATSAGMAPASAPTRTAAPKPISAASMGEGRVFGQTWRHLRFNPRVLHHCDCSMTPAKPATAVATTDSIMTPTKIRPDVAPPKLRRMPISRTL